MDIFSRVFPRLELSPTDEFNESLSTSQSTFDELILLNQLALAFPLPLEITYQIFACAGIDNVPAKPIRHLDPIRTRALSSDIVSQRWFSVEIPPSYTKVRLHTLGGDQGFVGQPNSGSWSWYTIQFGTILASEPEPPHIKTHNNPMRTAVDVFGMSAWFDIPPGTEIIHVYTNAQYPSWLCRGSEAVSPNINFSAIKTMQ